MADRRELEKLFRPRSARWRPSLAVVFAVALPTAVIFVLLEWTIRAIKTYPGNWQIAVIGVVLLLAGMAGAALTVVLLALAWLRR